MNTDYRFKNYEAMKLLLERNTS